MRRAMTCVYWEPKSRMTICSFIENEGEVSARLRGILREKNQGGWSSVVGCQPKSLLHQTYFFRARAKPVQQPWQSLSETGSAVESGRCQLKERELYRFSTHKTSSLLQRRCCQRPIPNGGVTSTV